MINIMRADPTQKFEYGPFTIRRLRPGHMHSTGNGSTFGPLAIVDHATLETGSRMPMHRHVNDEILTYVWRGSMVHEDASGNRTPLSAKKLMMMSAGSGISHEESTPIVQAETVQVIIRPNAADGEGRVQFMDRPAGISDNAWSLLAAPEGSGAPLDIRQEVWVYDVRLEKDHTLAAPRLDGFASWLYVLDGVITLGEQKLGKGDAASSDGDALPAINANRDATLLCLLVRLDAPAVESGTVSGH